MSNALRERPLFYETKSPGLFLQNGLRRFWLPVSGSWLLAPGLSEVNYCNFRTVVLQLDSASLITMRSRLISLRSPIHESKLQTSNPKPETLNPKPFLPTLFAFRNFIVLVSGRFDLFTTVELQVPRRPGRIGKRVRFPHGPATVMLSNAGTLATDRAPSGRPPAVEPALSGVLPRLSQETCLKLPIAFRERGLRRRSCVTGSSG